MAGARTDASATSSITKASKNPCVGLGMVGLAVALGFTVGAGFLWFAPRTSWLMLYYPGTPLQEFPRSEAVYHHDLIQLMREYGPHVSIVRELAQFVFRTPLFRNQPSFTVRDEPFVVGPPACGDRGAHWR